MYRLAREFRENDDTRHPNETLPTKTFGKPGVPIHIGEQYLVLSEGRNGKAE